MPSSRSEVFGPPLWFTLHTMAANYPDQAPASRRAACEGFLRNLPEMLPCGLCGRHLGNALAQQDLAAACSGRRSLAELLCGIHNEVNLRSGKPPEDCSQVVAQYFTSPMCASSNAAPIASLSRGGGSASSSLSGADGGACAFVV